MEAHQELAAQSDAVSFLDLRSEGHEACAARFPSRESRNLGGECDHGMAATRGAGERLDERGLRHEARRRERREAAGMLVREHARQNVGEPCVRALAECTDRRAVERAFERASVRDRLGNVSELAHELRSVRREHAQGSGELGFVRGPAAERHPRFLRQALDDGRADQAGLGLFIRAAEYITSPTSACSPS
jgi:hypothetical protein